MTEYTMNQYLLDSQRTAAHGEVGRELFVNDKQIVRQMFEFITPGQQADAMKRSLFYREINSKLETRVKEGAEQTAKFYEKIDSMESHNIAGHDLYFIHALLGIISEAGELVEAYAKAITENRSLDTVNLKEEYGDIMWYLAMGLRHAGVTFEETAERNIEKLKKRFPEKFTSENALNRDLDAERKALEGEAA